MIKYRENHYSSLFTLHFYKTSLDTYLLFADEIGEGDIVEADMDSGIIRDITTGKEYHTEPFPEFIQRMIENGGLMESAARGIIE